MTTLPIPAPDDEAAEGLLDRRPGPVDGRHLPSVFHACAPDDRTALARGPRPTGESATPSVAEARLPAGLTRLTRRGRLATRGRLARRDDDRGQATAEYGLVILVAGLIALGVIAWARDTGSFTDMFDSIVTTLTNAL